MLIPGDLYIRVYDALQESGHNRPMTSVKGAGYTSAGRSECVHCNDDFACYRNITNVVKIHLLNTAGSFIINYTNQFVGW